MKIIFEKINLVLAQWNPLNVDSHIAIDEYKRYVPLILNALADKNKLMNCLEHILNKMESGYDSQNEKHFKDLEAICNEIISVSKSE